MIATSETPPRAAASRSAARTGRQPHVTALTAMARGQRALVEATDQLVVCADESTLYRRAVELARDRLGLERCAIFVVEPDGETVRGSWGVALSGDVAPIPEQCFPLSSAASGLKTGSRRGAERWTVQHDRPLYDPGDPPVTVAHGWVATTAIRSSAGVTGLFFNDTACSGAPPDPIKQELAALLCTLVGSISERFRAEASLAEERAQQQRLGEQLRQAQKLEAVGRLAGGIAHDFNNMLAVINGYAELLLMTLPPGAEEEKAQEIRKAGERAAALTQQLLAFSRKQVAAPRVLDLGEVVSETHGMMRRLISEDIELVTLLAADLWPVRVDRAQLAQVLLNLALNSRDAMPYGGKLTMVTRNTRVDTASADLKAGEYVLLTVSDSGCGMDGETLARIFEPFFTTKERGKGTGLGLATAYGLIKQAGGHIQAESAPGEGTTFRIYLPRTDARVEAPPAPRPVSCAGGSETILVVEDEEMVRQFVVEVLRRHGYTVLDAMNGNEALRMLQQHKGAMDLVLTDVVMPGRNGRELARFIESRYRKTCILYMSGYTDDGVVRYGVSSASAHFIQKPFSADALAVKVREVLAAGSPLV